MAHGITLELRKIELNPLFIPSHVWKREHEALILWNGTGIRPSYSYRSSRRNIYAEMRRMDQRRKNHQKRTAPKA